MTAFRRDVFFYVVIVSVPTLLFQLLGWTWLSIPWVPIAMIGTGVVFIVGFKNNTAYNRLWEARQIYRRDCECQSFVGHLCDRLHHERKLRQRDRDGAANNPHTCRAPTHRVVARTAPSTACTETVGTHDQSVQPRIPKVLFC